ncbi:unnamed protein product [Heterobilharzia americana]|nr:unnamed protein product [Heterobilharzia americana]
MEVANKLATLSGDVLLASVSTSLARLHHAKVVDVISEAIGNMMEAEFHELVINLVKDHSDFQYKVEKDFDGDSIQMLDGTYTSPADKWLSFVQLSRGALLGSCCEAALLLIERHISSLSSTPNKVNPSWSDISSVVKCFGSTWACLTRLTEEREHIQRTWLSNQTANTYWSAKGVQFMKRNTSTIPSIIPQYSEFGLSEPTFADAILSCSTSRTHHKLRDIIDEVLLEYNHFGRELAEKLREYFAQIVSKAEQLNGNHDGNNNSNDNNHLLEVENSSGLRLLGNMVDKLISDSNCC